MRALFVVAAMLAGLGCNPPGKDSTKPNPATPPATGGESANASVMDPDLKKELDRLEVDAKAAVAAGDWITARQLIRQGIEATESNRDWDLVTARFLLLKGEVALNTGDHPNARRYFTDAMAIFHVRKNDPGRFETFMALGRLEARSGDYAAAERQFTEAKTLQPQVTDKALLGKFAVDQGRLAAREMDHKEASALYKEALQMFDTIKDNNLRGETLLLLAQEEEMMGHMGTSRQSLQRAVKLFGEVDNLDGKARAVHRLATYAERDKKYASARKLFGEALELYRKLDQQTAATSVERHLSALPVPEKDKKKK